MGEEDSFTFTFTSVLLLHLNNFGDIQNINIRQQLYI